MLGHRPQSRDEHVGRHRPDPGKQIDICEIAPASVRGATFVRGHDLLREHHGQRISAHDDLTAEQAGKPDEARLRPDWIADIDIDVESNLRGRELCGHGDANARVLVLVADLLRLRGRRVEDHAVWPGLLGNGGHDLSNTINLPRHLTGGDIDVGSGPPNVVRREQDSALDDQLGRVWTVGQPGQEALQHIEPQILVGQPTVLARDSAQTQLGIAGGGPVGWASIGHSRISKAERSLDKVRGK